jgi:hypothetical protein
MNLISTRIGFKLNPLTTFNLPEFLMTLPNMAWKLLYKMNINFFFFSFNMSPSLLVHTIDINQTRGTLIITRKTTIVITAGSNIWFAIVRPG